MRAVAVVEGAGDAGVLAEMLSLARRGREPKVEIVASGSVSGATSLARTLLLDPATTVALVLDAEAVEGEDLADRRRYLSASLADVRPGGWEIFLLPGLSHGKPVGYSLKSLEAVGDFFWPSKSPQQVHRRLEARLLESLTRWLEAHGWTVRTKAQREVDAIATRDGVVLRIEAKVSPTSSSGKNDANRFREAVYRAMSLLSSRDGLVAIAVTDTPGMRRAVNEVEGSLRLLGVAVFLVSSDGSVIEQLPLADIATG